MHRAIGFQNNLGFSLYTMLFICCLVITLESETESKRERFLIEGSILP